jgi:hypothetical protein
MLELKAAMRWVDEPEFKIRLRYWQLALYNHPDACPGGAQQLKGEAVHYILFGDKKTLSFTSRSPLGLQGTAVNLLLYTESVGAGLVISCDGNTPAGDITSLNNTRIYKTTGTVEKNTNEEKLFVPWFVLQ